MTIATSGTNPPHWLTEDAEAAAKGRKSTAHRASRGQQKLRRPLERLFNRPAAELNLLFCHFFALCARLKVESTANSGTQLAPSSGRYSESPLKEMPPQVGSIRFPDCLVNIHDSSFGAVSFAPSGLTNFLADSTHGLRRGLHSFAASRLWPFSQPSEHSQNGKSAAPGEALFECRDIGIRCQLQRRRIFVFVMVFLLRN